MAIARDAIAEDADGEGAGRAAPVKTNDATRFRNSDMVNYERSSDVVEHVGKSESLSWDRQKADLLGPYLTSAHSPRCAQRVRRVPTNRLSLCCSRPFELSSIASILLRPAVRACCQLFTNPLSTIQPLIRTAPTSKFPPLTRLSILLHASCALGDLDSTSW